MRFAVALLALASAVAAQTSGFDVITKPTKDTNVPAGAAYTIEWTPSAQKGTVSLTLLAGSSPQTLQIQDTIKTGVKSSAGNYTWTVPSTLETSSIYGIKISLDSDPSTFQYSFPFHIVGSSEGKSAATTAASTESAAASTSAPASASSAPASSSISSVVTSSEVANTTASHTSTSATSTHAATTVTPVSSAAPTSSAPATHHKTTTFITSTKTTAAATTTPSTISASSAASATPSTVTTSGGVAGRTVSLAALLGGLTIAFAAL